MKKIFVMAALSLAAISCTKSDVLDSPVLDQEISFNTYLGKAPVSKATIQDNTSVMGDSYSFTVKAIKHLPEEGNDGGYTVEEFSKQLYMNRRLSYVANTGEGATGGSWKYDGTPVYWPTDGSSLKFVAFGNNATSFTVKQNSNTEFQYTVPDNLADQQDLIVASTGIHSQTDQNPAVELQFKHLLSRIGFSLTSNASTPVHILNLRIEGEFHTTATVNLLNDLALAPVDGGAKVGKYDIITAKSTFVPGTENVPIAQQQVTIPAESEGGEPTTVSAVSVDNRFLMIIPQGATKIVGKYSIGEDATPRTIEIDLTNVDKLTGGFLAGKAYEFVLNVKTYEISFSVNVVDWDEQDDFSQNI